VIFLINNGGYTIGVPSGQHRAPNDSLIFIESVMEPHDAPAAN
jgi:hypothetical protein